MVSSAILSKISDFYSRWIHTPYKAGQQVEGVAVDCIRLLAAFGCFLEDREQIEVTRLPQDVAFHRPDTARAAIRKLMENFPKWQRLSAPVIIEPGDLLVVGPPGVPSHGMLAIHRRSSLIHAVPGEGVVQAGMYMDPQSCSIHSVFRSSDRSNWVLAQ